jgi:hypothetical protein
MFKTNKLGWDCHSSSSGRMNQVTQNHTHRTKMLGLGHRWEIPPLLEVNEENTHSIQVVSQVIAAAVSAADDDDDDDNIYIYIYYITTRWCFTIYAAVFRDLFSFWSQRCQLHRWFLHMTIGFPEIPPAYHCFGAIREKTSPSVLFCLPGWTGCTILQGENLPKCMECALKRALIAYSSCVLPLPSHDLVIPKSRRWNSCGKHLPSFTSSQLSVGIANSQPGQLKLKQFNPSMQKNSELKVHFKVI